MVTKRKPKPVKPVSMQTRQDRIFYAQDAIARLERSLRQNPYGLVGNNTRDAIERWRKTLAELGAS